MRWACLFLGDSRHQRGMHIPEQLAQHAHCISLARPERAQGGQGEL